ncbi:MAG: response regulator transcription factor [Chloroflexota bacterium]
MHLLVIEDDPRLGRQLVRLLAGDRHVVELAPTGGEGLDVIEAGTPIDVLILDLGLPDMSGLEVARRLRRSGASLPILILTARDAIDERVAGLDAGADDYLVKPFAYAELAARLRALSRREPHLRPNGNRWTSGPIVLDEARREVTVDGRIVDLTRREFGLLEALLRHPDQVLTRGQLLDHAWPLGVAVTPNTVDAYVAFLRRKLGPVGGARIETARGTGYRLAGDARRPEPTEPVALP